ncbi:MAG: type IV pili methyl-accepting chemotaxis transducer N-terminal domain-containing protein, partial [Vibrio sp.]
MSPTLTKPTKPIANTIAMQMTFIVTLSLFVICIALVTLLYSLRDAEVVNVSGSMRMQSYRLAYDLLNEDEATFQQHKTRFDESLLSPAMQSLNSAVVPNHIQIQYSNLVERW